MLFALAPAMERATYWLGKINAYDREGYWMLVFLLFVFGWGMMLFWGFHLEEYGKPEGKAKWRLIGIYLAIVMFISYGVSKNMQAQIEDGYAEAVCQYKKAIRDL